MVAKWSILIYVTVYKPTRHNKILRYYQKNKLICLILSLGFCIKMSGYDIQPDLLDGSIKRLVDEVKIEDSRPINGL